MTDTPTRSARVTSRGAHGVARSGPGRPGGFPESGSARPGETEDQRLDRNWTELLQELRVTQTGVQLLTGFLLTLPFQQRFVTLRTPEQDIYLLDVALATSATVLLIAPVLMHRLLFREHQRRRIVRFAHHCAMAGGVLFGAALVGVVYLIFDVVRGSSLGIGAACCAGVLTVSTWVAAPWRIHREGMAR